MNRTGLARALSKLGFCSRSQGFELIRAGRVRLNGRVCMNPEQPVLLDKDDVRVDGASLAAAAPVYLMLNKPRGLVTTARDEQGRDTIFSLLKGAGLPHLGPVGRLDKASEGLLLLTNDTSWAHRVTDPASHLPKTYHAQTTGLLGEAALTRFAAGIRDDGERLRLPDARVLRQGEKNTWLEIVLTEGRNRHIRRVLEAFGIEVLRLVRVAVGPLVLGELAKGGWRHLTTQEVSILEN
ncbi:MAG TPA: pseudouridine synthase [Verrucomicrobiales bacterium]|nr:pseudouridine synthase [Verrucomicrobiales bacterium]